MACWWLTQWDAMPYVTRACAHAFLVWAVPFDLCRGRVRRVTDCIRICISRMGRTFDVCVARMRHVVTECTRICISFTGAPFDAAAVRHVTARRAAAQQLPVNMGAFVGLTLGAMALAILRAVQWFRSSIAISQSLHDRMLARVVAAPLAFFTANPIGRLLNRFSKDLGCVRACVSAFCNSGMRTRIPIPEMPVRMLRFRSAYPHVRRYVDDALPLAFFDFLSCLLTLVRAARRSTSHAKPVFVT